MSAHPQSHVVQLDSFQAANFIADATRAASQGHPEAAGTPCQCRAPEPCWAHDPTGGALTDPAVAPLTAPMAAVTRPRPTPYPRPVSAATAEAGAALEALTAGTTAGVAPSRCQCVAPHPCTLHPDDRPLLALQPEWNEPHPDSPVGRTRRRLEHDRACGVLPGAEPGQGVGVLPFLTDHELGAWTQAVLAEHHRRQSRFADYRRGAQAAQHRLDRKDAS